MSVRFMLALLFFFAYFLLCLIIIGFLLTFFSSLIALFVTMFVAGEGGRKRTNMFRDRYWTEPKITGSDAIVISLIVFLVLSEMFLFSHLLLRVGLTLALFTVAVIFILGLLFSIILATSIPVAGNR